VSLCCISPTVRDAASGIGFDEFVVETKEGVNPGVHIADIGRGVGRIQQEHGTDFDFVGVGRAGAMRTSSEHGGAAL
jgi:hypothetical protein